MLFSVVAVAVAVVLLLVACRLCLRVGGASTEAERLYVFCFWSKVRTHARVAWKQLKWECGPSLELLGSNSVASRNFEQKSKSLGQSKSQTERSKNFWKILTALSVCALTYLNTNK